MTNLTLWLDAAIGVYSDAGVTPVANGGTAQQWNDQSGNGNNASQPTGASRPVWNTNQVNGLPALTFDGTDDYMSHGDTSEIGSVFIVYKAIGSLANYYSMMGADTTDAVALGSYYLQSSSGISNNIQQFSRVTTADSSGGVFATAASQPVQQAWDLYSGRFDGTSVSIYKRGVKMGPSVSRGANTVRPISNPVIGSAYYNRSVSGNNFPGQIAEIIKYSVNLSDANFAAVASYLNTKYGFAVTPSRFIWLGFEGPYPPSAGNQNLVTMTSPDAKSWPTILPSNYIPTTGHGFRDPSVLWDPSTATWWMTHTNNNFLGVSGTFDVAKSTDPGPPGYPINWSYVTTVDCTAVTGGTSGPAWSPSLFFDAVGTIRATFIGSTSSSTYPFHPYEVHPTNAGMTTWSTPVQITGTVLDTLNISGGVQVIYIGGVYNMIIGIQNTAGGSLGIGRATSGTLLSGYTVISQNLGSWSSGEGAQLFLNNVSGLYQIIVDSQGGGVNYATSPDLVTWSGLSGWTNVPIGPSAHPEQGNTSLLDLGP